MKELWNRVLAPLCIPLIAAAVIVVVVLNFSRVLLALEETNSAGVATVTAILVASGVLFGFAYFSSRGEARSGGNAAVLAVSGIVLLFAGVAGVEAIQDEHHKEEAAADGGEPVGKPDITVTAFDLGFREKDLKAAAGKVAIQYVNEGSILHTLLLDGVSGFKLEVPSKGAKDIAAVELEPATYTYYCDVAGHRAAGMEGKLTVTEGGAPGGGAAEGGAGGASAADVVAKDNLTFTPKEVSVPSGPVKISLKNEGSIVHTLQFDEVAAFKKLEVATKGDTAEGTLDVGPGTYTFFCDQPGHRAAGMEGKLTVAEGGAPAGGAAKGGAPASGGSAAEVLAKDIAFDPKEISVPSGPVKITMKNEGSILHTFLVEEVSAFEKLEVATKGDTDQGTLDVGPGTYTYYCDVAGHRAAGMEGKLKVG